MIGLIDILDHISISKHRDKHATFMQDESLLANQELHRQIKSS